MHFPEKVICIFILAEIFFEILYTENFLSKISVELNHDNFCASLVKITRFFEKIFLSFEKFMLKFIQLKEIFIKILNTNIHGTEEIACDFENERKIHTLFHKSCFFYDSLHFLLFYYF
jgi:hypothetical protein